MWTSLIVFIVLIVAFIISKVTYSLIVTSNIYSASSYTSKKADAIYSVTKILSYMAIASFVIFIFLLTNKLLIEAWKQ